MKLLNNKTLKGSLKGMIATLTISLVATFVTMGFGFTPFASQAHAACPPLDTSRGVVTMNVTVPASGDYRVWSRIMASSSTNNSFYLEVDDSECSIVVGDSGSITTDAWRWVDYQNGSTDSKVTLNLSAGNHTIRMVGREDDVQVDRLLFLSDQACTPSGVGDNCAVSSSPEEEGPVYRLYSPSKGHHLYTTSASERDRAKNSLGYRDEGVAYTVSKVAGEDLTPIYRVYKSSLKKHHWTKSLSERNSLIAQGWRNEGIAWYVSAVPTDAPIYRVYKPQIRKHHWTKSISERNSLVANGWRNEGIAWYGLE